MTLRGRLVTVSGQGRLGAPRSRFGEETAGKAGQGPMEPGVAPKLATTEGRSEGSTMMAMDYRRALLVLAAAATTGALAAHWAAEGQTGAAQPGREGSSSTESPPPEGSPPDEGSPESAATSSTETTASPPAAARSPASFAPPSAALFEYHARSMRRRDGEPYTLHRWRVRLSDVRFEVVYPSAEIGLYFVNFFPAYFGK